MSGKKYVTIFSWLFKIFLEKKRILILGSLVLPIVVGVISLISPKVYEMTLTIEPGIQGIDGNGKTIVIDNYKEVQQLIASGTLNNQIINNLKKKNVSALPNKLSFKVYKKTNEDLIEISYRSVDQNIGKIYLNEVFNLLKSKFNNQIEYFTANNQNNIKILNQKIKITERAKESLEVELNKFTREKKSLEKSINVVTENLENLKFIKNRSDRYNKITEDRVNSTILLNVAISQSLDTLLKYQKEISGYETDRIITQNKIDNYSLDLIPLREQLEHFDKSLKSINNIKIAGPIKVIEKNQSYVFIVNVTVAFILGFFVMFLAVIFIEYFKTSENIVDNN